VIDDEFIYFPSVYKKVLDYSLIEEAEKDYFHEDDEFPVEYSAALRAVAANYIGDEDTDYMESMAIDLD